MDKKPYYRKNNAHATNVSHPQNPNYYISPDPSDSDVEEICVSPNIPRANFKPTIIPTKLKNPNYDLPNNSVTNAKEYYYIPDEDDEIFFCESSNQSNKKPQKVSPIKDSNYNNQKMYSERKPKEFHQPTENKNFIKNEIKEEIKNEPFISQPSFHVKNEEIKKEINFKPKPNSQNPQPLIKPQPNNQSNIKPNIYDNIKPDISQQHHFINSQVNQDSPSKLNQNPEQRPQLVHPSLEIPNSYILKYDNIDVKFPFPTPYPAQDMLISNALKAFANSQNALLESPTGTGKSLSLLSASLAFQEKNPSVTRIFYTSRTHAQLQQLVGELKKLPYFPRLSLLAARRHLCIHPQVSKSENVDIECRKTMRRGNCPYAANKSTLMPMAFTPQGENPKYLLSDLKKYGMERKICPYSLSKIIFQNAQLVICPYNYIVSPGKTSTLAASGSNSSIAIFDEGHNIENISRDEASMSLFYFQLFSAGNDAASAPDGPYSQLFNDIRLITADLGRFINDKRKEFNAMNEKNQAATKYIKGPMLQKLFNQISPNNISNIGSQMINWVNQIVNNPNDKQFSTDSLIAFCETTGNFFSLLSPSNFDSFRVAYVPSDNGDVNRDMVKILCMRPAILFEGICKNTRSVIIASGTLSPLDSFAAELETSFPVRVSAPHVVDASQVLTMTINSHNGIPITSKFSVLQSQSKDVYDALGQVISRTLPTVPGGSLLFMPSYYSKEAALKRWKQTDEYTYISSVKNIVEERSEISAKKIIKTFNSHRDGALLVGVCRGKISEGLDFSDDLSRIVYVFGIPYASYKEADVELKMHYNDGRKSHVARYLSGSDWYNAQAFRALFQSVGRCLRHSSDYGAIVFMDSRIESNLGKLPAWISKNLHSSINAENAAKLLSSFYTTMFNRFPGHIQPPIMSRSPYRPLSTGVPIPTTLPPALADPATWYEPPPPKFDTRKIYPAEDVKMVKFNPLSEDVEMVSYTYNNTRPNNLNDNIINNNSVINRSICNMNGAVNYTVDADMNNTEYNQIKKEKKCKVRNFLHDDDDDDMNNEKMSDHDNLSLTNLFCVKCSHPIIRIKNLELAQFKVVKGLEFFQIIEKQPENEFIVLSLLPENIKFNFIQTTNPTKWCEIDDCAYTRGKCSCGETIAAIVKSVGDDCPHKKGEIILLKEMLSMQYCGKLMSLAEIASQ
ncbi:hypothetical protein TRFO_10820 [Tritrichomonas foetus]|uniref:Helicase ATP-binding domain-containing protein n=1 Tax=Tritrichomonas foetus TaxID=1144522 RepID=A0A1J4JB50_9EUKA|nr:hypothetical protein TRFO_10820 [Tritrichomonas foetus]|eukprot:OHS94883.1 hypothetical protein TRFO_10820 [Tritrichomonas foetus]